MSLPHILNYSTRIANVSGTYQFGLDVISVGVRRLTTAPEAFIALSRSCVAPSIGLQLFSTPAYYSGSWQNSVVFHLVMQRDILSRLLSKSELK